MGNTSKPWETCSAEAKPVAAQPDAGACTPTKVTGKRWVFLSNRLAAELMTIHVLIFCNPQLGSQCTLSEGMLNHWPPSWARCQGSQRGQRPRAPSTSAPRGPGTEPASTPRLIAAKAGTSSTAPRRRRPVIVITTWCGPARLQSLSCLFGGNDQPVMRTGLPRPIECRRWRRRQTPRIRADPSGHRLQKDAAVAGAGFHDPRQPRSPPWRRSPVRETPWRHALLTRGLGRMLLLAIVIGSGIMAERLSGGNTAVACSPNTGATVGSLYVLIGAGPHRWRALQPGSRHGRTALRGSQTCARALACVVAQLRGGAIRGRGFARHVCRPIPDFNKWPSRIRSGPGLVAGRSGCACRLSLALVILRAPPATVTLRLVTRPTLARPAGLPASSLVRQSRRRCRPHGFLIRLRALRHPARAWLHGRAQLLGACWAGCWPRLDARLVYIPRSKMTTVFIGQPQVRLSQHPGFDPAMPSTPRGHVSGNAPRSR